MRLTSLDRMVALAMCALLGAKAHAQDISVLNFKPPASPEARTMPDAARTPVGPLDFGFAIAEVCYPFILDNASPEQLSQRSGIRPLPEYSGETTLGVHHAVTIGTQSPIVIIMRQMPAGRSCALQVNDEDVTPTPDLMAAMREWPAPLKVVRPPVYDDIDGAMSTIFCAVNPSGGEDVLSIKVVALEPDYRPLSLEAGFMRNPERQPLACDPDYFRVDG